MEDSKILNQHFLMPWDIKSDDPVINRLNESLRSSDLDLAEESQNTMPFHTSTDEDCLHKASGQSDSMGKKRLRSTTATTVQKTPSRKQVLLSNPTIKRWYDNLARGSTITAYQRLYRLDKFCKEHQMTPMQLADLAMKDLNAVTNLLADHITAMGEQGSSGSYTQSFVVAVKSWLENFDIKLVRRLKVSNRNATPTLEMEKVPESQEIAEMFSRADLREGAIESLIAKAGRRYWATTMQRTD